MSLIGVEFILFFPAVFLLHWILPRRAPLQNLVLLLASIFFYATWNWRVLPILGGAIAVSYGAARLLARNVPDDDDKVAAAPIRRRRKTILTLAIIAELGLLGVFKYAGFFAVSLNTLLGSLGLPDAMPILRLVLPLGISYTTLIQVGYLLEVYWERAPASRDPLAYGVFVGFFPQLIAGPIVRTRAMLPQYEAPRHLSPDGIAGGASAFLTGFLLKAFVADWLAPRIVDPVFADPAAFGALSLWVGLFGYATQLFCDFAGYSLMAIGTGRFFGLELPENFRYPLFSTSLAEFWRRWHITLNTWLFDYLFAPLTTGRSWFRGRAAMGFLVVFLVSGLWHGATWTFVLWGLFHGMALAVHFHYDEAYKRLCRKDRKWVARRRSRPYILGAWLVTQFFFLMTLLPFRASDLGSMAAYVRGMVGLGGDGRLDEQFGIQAALVVAVFAGFHLLEFGPGPAWKNRFLALPAPVRGACYGMVVVFLFVFVPVGASTFIYAQF